MSNVLSIAGLDPSGGAGLLADIKSFHQLEVNGFGVSTAYTYQTDSNFSGLQWASRRQIINQLEPLLETYEIAAVKVGLMPSLEMFAEIIALIDDYQSECKIVWDPVIKASAGFEFHKRLETVVLKEVLQSVYCVTPNLQEADFLARELSIDSMAELHGTHVIVKGGHGAGDLVEDVLIKENGSTMSLMSTRLEGKSIHGSGCVFSAVLAAALVLGLNIEDAFAKAHHYVYQLIEKSGDRLGRHHLIEL